MRLVIPKEIERLADFVMPYLVMNENEKKFVVRDDAPQEVKAAYKEYCDWMQAHYHR